MHVGLKKKQNKLNGSQILMSVQKLVEKQNTLFLRTGEVKNKRTNSITR